MLTDLEGSASQSHISLHTMSRGRRPHAGPRTPRRRAQGYSNQLCIPPLLPGRSHGARIRCVQGSCSSANQGVGKRMGGEGHQCQRHCARIYRHRDEYGVDRRQRAGGEYIREDTDRAVGKAGGFQGRCHLSCERGELVRVGSCADNRWWLDGSVDRNKHLIILGSPVK